MKIADFKAKLHEEFMKRMAYHGYTATTQARLGKGDGKGTIAADGAALPRQVWVHSDDPGSSSAGNLFQATLATADIVRVNDPNLENQAVVVGNPPGALGIPGQAVLSLGGLQGYQADRQGTPTEQYIFEGLQPHLTVATTDNLTVLKNIAAIYVPPGSLTSGGANVAVLNFGTSTNNNGTGTPPGVPNVAGNVNSYATITNTANRALTSTLTAINFDTLIGTGGYASYVDPVVSSTSTLTSLSPFITGFVIQVYVFLNHTADYADVNLALSIDGAPTSTSVPLTNGVTAVSGSLTGYAYTFNIYLFPGQTVQVLINSTGSGDQLVPGSMIFFGWTQPIPGNDQLIVRRSTVNLTGMSSGGTFVLTNQQLIDNFNNNVRLFPGYTVEWVSIIPPGSPSTTTVAITDGGSNTIASADNFDLSSGVPGWCFPAYTVPGSAPLTLNAVCTGAVGGGTQKMIVEVVYG